VKDDVLFDTEKSLRANEAGLTDFAAFAIAVGQRNRESIGVRAARDLAENQIRAGEIGNDQSGPALSAIGSRKRNDNDFAGYRFDHAASSSGEFQSRPRTDSPSSAPLKDSSRACSGDSLPIDSSVGTVESSHVNGISEIRKF
jgi:hypothetical protein